MRERVAQLGEGGPGGLDQIRENHIVFGDGGIELVGSRRCCRGQLTVVVVATVEGGLA